MTTASSDISARINYEKEIARRLGIETDDASRRPPLIAATPFPRQNPLKSADSTKSEGFDTSIKSKCFSKEDFRRKVEHFISRFWAERDMEDLMLSVMELEVPGLSYYFVRLFVQSALDVSLECKELASQALAYMHGPLLSTEAVGQGFYRLLSMLSDVEIDVPDAANQLAKFLARAVYDDILPPLILNEGDCFFAVAPAVVTKAKEYLSLPNYGSVLQSIWVPLKDTE